MMEATREGSSGSDDPAGCTRNVTAPTTTTTPMTQPSMNATLAARARGASSIRITAMIGHR